MLRLLLVLLRRLLPRRLSAVNSEKDFQLSHKRVDYEHFGDRRLSHTLVLVVKKREFLQAKTRACLSFIGFISELENNSLAVCTLIFIASFSVFFISLLVMRNNRNLKQRER